MCVCIEESVLKYRCCGSYNIVITFTKLMSLTQTSLHIFSLKRKKKNTKYLETMYTFSFMILWIVYGKLELCWTTILAKRYWNSLQFCIISPIPTPPEQCWNSVSIRKCTWKAEVCAQTINVWRISKRSNVLLRRQF